MEKLSKQSHSSQSQAPIEDFNELREAAGDDVEEFIQNAVF